MNQGPGEDQNQPGGQPSEGWAPTPSPGQQGDGHQGGQPNPWDSRSWGPQHPGANPQQSGGNPQQPAPPFGQYSQAAPPPYGQPGQFGQPNQFGQPAQQPQGPGSPNQSGGNFQNWGQPPQPPTGAPGGQPPNGRPQQPMPNKKAMLIAGAIIAVIVVAGGAIFGIIKLTTGGASSGDKPEAVVSTYLHALADGDAQKALDQGAKPPTADFVTDDILKKQQKIAKITDIQVDDSNSSAIGTGFIHATYKFGDRTADVKFNVSKSGDKWKIDHTTDDVDTGYLNVPKPTLFGKAIGKRSKIYVFPGPLQWGSENPNFDVTSKRSDDFPMGGLDDSFTSVSQLDASLNDKGKVAAESAVKAKLDECAAQTNAHPAGCPQQVYGGAKDGTVHWTAPADLSRLEYSYYGSGDQKESVDVSGLLTWKVTYQDEDGATRTDDDDMESTSGKVDLSTPTPTFAPRS